MVAIISGNSQGLGLTSLATLGQRGVLGQASSGRNGEQAFVNVSTGNLVLQDRDDVLMSHGQNLVALRTYNSQGLLNDDNGDNWTSGFYGQQLKLLGGSVNTAGATLLRTDRDGAQSKYTFVGTPAPHYVSTDGAGAYDSISYDSAKSQYVWVDGQTGASARYGASDGRLVSMSDAMGNRTDYTYDTASGRLLSAKSASGETTYYDYSGSNLTQIRTVDANAVTLTRVRYAYDTSNRLSSVTVDLSPADNSIVDGKTYVTNYTYDGTSKRVATVTQTDGTSLAITYDASGRVATLKDALGQTTTFTYDTVNRTGTVIDPLLRQTVYSYDATGQLTKIQAPVTGGVSPTTTFTYNANGDLLQTVDGEGHAVDMAYDANGNQILQRDAVGNTVTRTYASNNQLQTETVYLTPDPDGAGAGQPGVPLTTRYVYGSMNAWQLRFVLSPEGRVTEYRYNNYGERTASIQYQVGSYAVAGLAQTAVPTEAQVSTWAGAQTLTATTRTDLTYDARGQLQTSTTWNQVDATGLGVADGKQALTQYVYNQVGLLLKTVSPTTGVSQFTYDGLGRILTSTDAANQTTLTSYNDAGGKTAVTAANGLVTTSAYDKAGRLVSVQQSSPQSTNLGMTRYVYDANNRLIMTVDPTGAHSWFLYDEDGRKVADINDSGALIETSYNKNDQVTRTIAYSFTVSRDALVNASDNPLNPALSAIRPAGLPADQKTWYAYDDANRLSKKVSPTGAVTETTYDGASRVIKVTCYAALIATSSLGSTPTAASIAPVPDANADRITRNFYDNDGLSRGMLDAEGYLVEFRYNSTGQLTKKIAYATQATPALWAAGTLAQLIPATSPQDQATTYVLNSKGQTAGVVDAEGYLTENVFDAEGNITQTVRYANKVTATVNSASTMVTLRPTASSQDRSSSWQYDALNRVIQATNFEGTVTSNQYDAVGNLVSSTVGAGLAQARTLSQRYDVQGRLVGELTGEGSAQLTGNQTQAQIDAIWSQYGVTHAYDAAGRRISTRDQYGNTTLFYYDKLGHQTYVINALGEVSESTYNALGQLSTTTQFSNRISKSGLSGGFSTTTLVTALTAARSTTMDQQHTYTYGVSGLLASDVQPSVNNKTRSYNTFGDLTYVGSTAISRTGMEYDRRGLAKSSGTNAFLSNNPTVYTRDAFGRVINTQTQGISDKQSLSYDRLGRQVTSTDASLKVTVSTYDAFGQTLTCTDALNATTTYTYDRANRSIKVTTPEGVSVTTLHNEFGQTAQTTDANGNTTTFQYDKNGNLKTTVTPLTTSSNVYDRANRLIQTVDATGNVVAIAYDAANRVLTRTVDPSGLNLVTSYAYFVPDANVTDAKGRMMTVTDPNGVVTKLIYGINGQLVQQIVDPLGLKLVTNYTYDGDGRTLTVTSPGGTLTQYTYDSLGRRIKEQIDPSGLNLTRSYVYDVNDNLTSSTDANGNVTLYAYDVNHRLVYTVDAAGNVLQNVYDADGQVTQTRTYAKAINITGLTTTPTVTNVQAKLVADPADQIQNRVYDKDGRLTATVSALGEVVKFTYDGNGNVTTRMAYAQRIDMAKWTQGTLPAPTPDVVHDQVVRTVYDALNRATFTVDGTGSVVAQTYDGNGRITQRTAYAQAIPLVTAATDTAVRAAVAMVASAGTDVVTRYVYDTTGRQAYSLSSVGSAGQAAVTQTIYDANGNRVKQVRYANTVALTANPSTVVANAADATQMWAYDTANRQIYSVDATGAVTAQVYDANGNAVASKQYATVLAAADLAKIQAAPNSTVATLLAVLPASLGGQDRITHRVFDAASRLRYSVDAEGGITQYVYDAQGHITQQIEYAHATASLTLADNASAADVVAKITADAANDRVTRTFFDASGRQRFELDALGYVTETNYAAAGKVTTLRYAQKPAGITLSSATADIAVAVVALASNTANHQTQQRFDAAGRVFETVDTMGVLTHREFDALGRLLSETQAYGLAEQTQTTYDYNAQGLAVAKTVAAGTGVSATTLYGYDALGHLTSQINPNGVALQSDNAAWAQSERQRLGYPSDATTLTLAQKQALLTAYTTTNIYNAAGKLVRTVNALGATTSTQYDTFGNAVKVTDPNGNVGYFYYDKLNRVSLQVDPEGYATQTQYWLGLSDKIASVRRYATKVAANTNETAVPALQTNSAQDGLTTYTYDRLDRILSTTERVGTGTATESVQYADASGSRFNKVVTNKLGGSAIYSVDQLGQTIQETLPTGVVNAYQYDAFGNRIQTIEAQGLPEQRTTTYRYDKAGRTTHRIGQAYTALNASTLATQSVIPVEQTTYDALGRAIEVRKSATWDGSNAVGGSRTLSYFDAQGHQIASLAADGAYTAYTLDDNGNILVQASYATRLVLPSSAGGAAPAASLDAANDRVTHYVYDALGRQTQAIRDSVLYWEPGTDSQISLGSSLGQVQLQQTAYDPAGNAVRVTDGRGNSIYTYYDKLGRKTLSIDQEGYATAWDYANFQNVATRETRYSTRVPSYAMQSDSGVAANLRDPVLLRQSIPAGTTEPDRVTEYVIDTSGHVLEKRVKNVAYQYTDANGAVQSGSADAVTGYSIDGLGHTTQLRERVSGTDASNVTNVTDIVYDKLGREVERLAPGFVDFQGNTVRPTSDIEYNGLGVVTRTIQRGTNSATEADDRITSYQYNVNGDQVSQTDAEGNATVYELDAQGHIARSTLKAVKNADGAVADQATTYQYDAAGRQIQTTDIGTGEVRKTEYNAFGEISRKGLGDGRQELIEYNTLGLVQKSNSGDGVTKIYLYDRNGNATRQINSSTQDLTSVSVSSAAADTSLMHTFSVYDRKNQLVKTVEPEISFLQDSISVKQAFTQQLADLYGAIQITNSAGGSYAGAIASSTAFQPTTVGASGQYGLLPQSNVPYVSDVVSVNILNGAAQPGDLNQIGAFGFKVYPDNKILVPSLNYQYAFFTDTGAYYAAPGALFDFNRSSFVSYYGGVDFSVKLGQAWVVLSSFDLYFDDSWLCEPYFYSGSNYYSNSNIFLPIVTGAVRYEAFIGDSQNPSKFLPVSAVDASGYQKIDSSSLAAGTYALTIQAYDVNGKLVGGESSTLTIDNGAILSNRAAVQVSDFRAYDALQNRTGGVVAKPYPLENKFIFFDKFSNLPSSSIRVRDAALGGNYSIQAEVKNGFFAVNQLNLTSGHTYDFIVTANNSDWYGGFVMGEGLPIVKNRGMLQLMQGRDVSKSDRGQTVTLNLANTIFSFDGDYSHYHVDIGYQKPDGSWASISGKSITNGQVTLGLDTDLSLLNASAFIAGATSYSYSVYKEHGANPLEMVGRGNGVWRYGASSVNTSTVATQPYYLPKGQIQLPARVTAIGPVSVVYNGTTTVLNAGDWRAALNTSNNILTLDLTSWMWASNTAKTFNISFKVGLDSYTTTLTMDMYGKVTASNLSRTSPSPNIPLSVSGASSLGVLQVGRSDSALSTVSAGLISTSGSTFTWNASAQQSQGGTWRYYYEALGSGGALVGKGFGTLTVNADGTLVSTPDAPLLKPAIVSFTPPNNTAGFTLQVRPKNSTGAYTSYPLTTPFQWNATALRPASGSVDFEYLFVAKDSAGNNVGKGSGVITINSVGQTSSTLKMDRQPTKINLQSPPGRHVPQLSFDYRAAGSTGAYTHVTVAGVWSDALNATAFTWDASALAPETGTSTYEYKLRMQNADGSDFKNELGEPVTADGQMVLGGNTGAPLSFQQYVQTLNVSAQVKHMQTYNAFGEVVSEYDDKVAQRMQDMLTYYKGVKEYANDAAVKNATIDTNSATVKSTYNALGQLISKTDPQTWVTSETGTHSRVAPVTRYGYDLLGRLNTATDANNHQQRQSFVGSSSQLLTRQWAADGGLKQFSYDIMGDARQQTNELGAVTLQSYNKLDQLVQVDRLGITRVQNFGGGADGTPVASTLTDRYSYDMRGQRITHSDALNQISKTYYDSLGRVTQTVSPSGAAVSYSYVYMAAGTSNGILSTAGKNTGGYQRTTTGADGRSVVDKIDTFGRTTWHQDEGGRQYTYSYDAAGLLRSQSSTLGGNALQNILYDYYANGYVKSARDLSSHTLSRYGYDNAGNRTWESYSGLAADNTSPVGSYQNVTIQYDELNRMAHVKDSSVDMQYEYDAVGNRRAVHATYFDPLTAGLRQRDDMWYQYDAADRFTLTKGSLTAPGGQIVQGSQGVKIGYDLSGQRISAVNADGSAETYSYSTDGYLEDTKINGTLRARRRVDALGRTQEYIERNANNSIRQDTRNTYSADNRLQTAVSQDGTTKYFYYSDTADTNSAASQTGTGQLARTEYVPSAAGTSSKNYYTYQYWDDAKQLTIKTQAQNDRAPGWAPGTSQMAYDANGFLTDANDVAGGRTLHYTNSATGLVMRRDETSANKTYQHFYYYAAGKRIGDVATDPNDKFRKSYAEELAINLKNQPSTKDRFNNFKPVTSADFDQNYEPINANYPSATASSYTVRAGDTLASIAQTLWGDASMWYQLADANALKSTDTLSAGRVLTVPNKVTNIHNNANTFRPYNAGEMIGHVDPTLPASPPPPGKRCGGWGQILMVVVAVVATIYTAGAAGAYFGAAGTAGAGGFAGGLAVLGGAGGLTAAALGAAAVGAAVGSAASQLVGMATGDVKSFSWKAVGQSALAAGITAGVGSALSPAATSAGAATGAASANATAANTSWLSGTYAHAAVTAAASTGMNMVLHGTWSWRQMGASVVGSMVGAGAGDVMGSALGNSVSAQASQFAQRLAGGFAGGWASSEVMAGNSNFSRADSSVLFASAMGNAIGQGIADGTDSQNSPQQSFRQSEIREQNAQAQSDALYGLAGSGSSGLGLSSGGGYGLSTGGIRATGSTLPDPSDVLGGMDDRNGMDVASDNYNGSRRTATVQAGQGPLQALAGLGLSKAQQQAGYGYLLQTGQVQMDRNGVPQVQAGQQLHIDLDDSSAAGLGGRAIASESAGRAARMAAAAQAATLLAADGMRIGPTVERAQALGIYSGEGVVSYGGSHGEMRASTDLEILANSSVGRVVKGMYSAWTALPIMIKEAALGMSDLVGASTYAAGNAFTGGNIRYEPNGVIAASIQDRGVLPTLGDGLRGLVLNAPGVGLVSGLYHRNPEEIGAGVFAAGLGGYGLYGERAPVVSSEGAATAGRTPPGWGKTPQATESLYTQNRSTPLSMEQAINHADRFDAFDGNLVDYEVTPLGSVKVDHGDGLSIHYRVMEDVGFDRLHGANKLAAYKMPKIGESVPFAWDDAFSDGFVNVHIRQSTFMSDRGAVAALSHEYLELLDVYNRVGSRALTPGKWQSFIDGAHERTVPQVDSIINNMVQGGH